jgi:hypothetical protein
MDRDLAISCFLAKGAVGVAFPVIGSVAAESLAVAAETSSQDTAVHAVRSPDSLGGPTWSSSFRQLPCDAFGRIQ